MRVRGSVIVTIPEFVKEFQGKEGLQLWLQALSSETRAIFESEIKICKWYPVEALLEGSEKVCRLFYHGSMDGARELGRYSSKRMLRNPLIRNFLSFGTLRRNIRKGLIIAQRSYENLKWTVEDCGDGSYIICFSSLPIEHRIIHERIAGWCEKGLDMNGTPITAEFVKEPPQGIFAVHIKPM